MEEDKPLEFLRNQFYVETCTGQRKLFTQSDNWELLNLKPNDILDIPIGCTRSTVIYPNTHMLSSQC
jgi:hypothetical protein